MPIGIRFVLFEPSSDSWYPGGAGGNFFVPIAKEIEGKHRHVFPCVYKSVRAPAHTLGWTRWLCLCLRFPFDSCIDEYRTCFVGKTLVALNVCMVHSFRSGGMRMFVDQARQAPFACPKESFSLCTYTARHRNLKAYKIAFSFCSSLRIMVGRSKDADLVHPAS
jgi:hypothetical protein